MADPTPVELAGALSTSATTTVNFSARAAGTLLLLSAACDDYRVASGTGTPESTGWTLLDARQGNLGCYVWWKIATGSETSVQYRIGSNARSAYSLVAVDNIAASPLGVTNGNTSAITTSLPRPQAAANVTPAAGDRWCVVATAGTTGNVTGGPYTWTGYTKLSERYTTAGYRPGVTVGVTTVDGGSSVTGTVNFTAATEQFMSIVAAWKVAPDTGGGSTTGTGSASAQAGTASGSGSVHLAGSGSAAAQAGSVAGAGSAATTGGGTATASAAAAAGAGATSTPATTGSGSAAASAAQAAGVGTSSTTGSGSATGATGTAVGSGAARTAGQGAAVAAPGDVDSSGQLAVTGTGAATAGAGLASGTTGTPTASGAGASTAAPGTADGSGTATTAGTGAAGTPAATVLASGAASVTGTGSATAPAGQVDSAGRVTDPAEEPAPMVLTVGPPRPRRYATQPPTQRPAGAVSAPRPPTTQANPADPPRYTVGGGT